MTVALGLGSAVALLRFESELDGIARQVQITPSLPLQAAALR